MNGYKLSGAAWYGLALHACKLNKATGFLMPLSMSGAKRADVDNVQRKIADWAIKVELDKAMTSDDFVKSNVKAVQESFRSNGKGISKCRQLTA